MIRRGAPCLIVALLLWAAVIGTPALAAAQSTAIDRELDEARTFYREGRFDSAIVTLRSAIEQLQQFRDVQARKVQLADAHLLLGLAHLAMRAEGEALDNFRQVVTLDPERTLDPEIFSPRVVALFDRARAEVSKDRNKPSPPPPIDPPNPELPVKPASAVVPITSGTTMRVRFSGAGRFVEGNLVGVDDRSLTIIDGDNQQSLTFPRDMVTRVDILGRQKGHALQFGLIGAGLGVLTGVVEKPTCTAETPPGVECWTRAGNIGAYSVGFGLIGALIGALYRTQEWVEVPLNRLAPDGKAADLRTGIAITVASWD